jgi:hypothetical protein
VLPILLRIAGPVLGFFFKQLGQTIQWISNVIRWIGRIGAALMRWLTGTKTTGEAVKVFAQRAAKAFSDIGKAVSSMWNGVIKPVFGFLVRAWLTVAGRIVHGAAIALGWVPGVGPKLKGAARAFDTFAAQVNRSLDNINDEGVNVKLKSTFTPPKGFSMHSIVGAQRGMLIPGYGGGDKVPIMAEKGEAVVPKDAVRDPGFQAWAAGKGIPGFRRGGLILKPQLFSPRGMERTQEGIDRRVADKTAAGIARNFKLLLAAGKPAVTAFVKSLDPLPYIWGGAGPGGYDCSGAVGAVHLAHLGKPHGHGQRIYTTSSIHAGVMGLKPGLGGTLDIGVTAGTGHMAGRYGKLRFEARGSRAGIIVGDAAKPPESFSRKFHLAKGGRIDQDLVNLLARSGADIGGDPGKLRINGKVVADHGAVLNPGLNLLENRTGRLEPLVPAGEGGVQVTVDLRGSTLLGGASEIATRLAPLLREQIRNSQRRGGVPAREQLR